jgi:mannose-1-phosphate guanylyltransferase
MKISHAYCVIMAGGAGTRFWPSSTKDHPKQFIDILGTGETLLQATFRRYAAFIPKENIFISTNTQYVNLVLTQLPELNPENVIPEPARRNTAPCILYACMKLKKRNPSANIVISPSDHLITNEQAYQEAILKALTETEQNNFLLTLGIKPHAPKTGFGYIQFSDSIKALDPDIKKVKTFTEKPDLEHAKMFLESGDFLWNAGIFVWNANSILNAFDKYLPDMYLALEAGWEQLNSGDELAFINKIYGTLENESIDYGILEKAKNVYVLPTDFGWSDLGTWGALEELIEPDESKNIIINENALAPQSLNNLIAIPKGKIAIIAGVEDLIVVDSEKALLICRKDDEQTLKSYVSELRLKFGDKYV